MPRDLGQPTRVFCRALFFLYIFPLTFLYTFLLYTFPLLHSRRIEVRVSLLSYILCTNDKNSTRLCWQWRIYGVGGRLHQTPPPSGGVVGNTMPPRGISFSDSRWTKPQSTVSLIFFTFILIYIFFNPFLISKWDMFKLAIAIVVNWLVSNLTRIIKQTKFGL